VQHFFIESKEGFVWEKNCHLIDPADGSQECREVEALDGHGIGVALGLNHKDKIIIRLVGVGDWVLKGRVRGWGWGASLLLWV